MSRVRMHQLIETYRLATGSDAAALSLDGRPVVSSDASSSAVEAWQFVCDQGPSIDAYRGSDDIDVPDTTCEERWTVLSGVLGTWPFASVSAVPVGFGAGIAVGALTLYRCCAGALSPSEHDAARACADHAAEWLVACFEEPEGSVDFGQFDLIHRATGIVMEQTGLAPADAIAVIRAHAYTSQQGLAIVLQNIIERRLSLA